MNANKLNTCRPDNVGGFDDFGESDEFGEISSNCQMNANKLNTWRPDNVGGFDDFGESDEFGEISSNCQMNANKLNTWRTAMLVDLTMQKNDTSIPHTSNIGGQYYSHTPNSTTNSMHVCLVLQT